MGLDAANNVYFAIVVGDEIIIKIIGPHLDLDFPLAETGLVQGDPDLATNYEAVTYVSFTQFDESAPEEAGKSTSPATPGPLRHPGERLAQSSGRFRSEARPRSNGLSPPCLDAEDRGGDPGDGPLLGAGHTHAGARRRGFGEYPAIRVDEQEVVHLVYSRDNDIYYNNNRAEGSRARSP